MENNSDRMGFALIALSVVAFVLLTVNGPLKSTVNGFFDGFKEWQTQTVNDITETNKQVTHTAYSWSSDGTDRFTTTKPNLNLLDGTKDFSGDWENTVPWYKNGNYNGLAVMTFNTGINVGVVKGFKIPSDPVYSGFKIPSDGIYSMSMLVKVKTGSIGQFVIEATDKPAIIIDVTDTNGKFITQSYSGNFTSGQNILMYFRFNKDDAVSKDGISVAGHKIEHGSVATPYMPSASEVKPSDQPKYIGTYTNKSDSASQEPSDYTWKLNPEYHE